MSPLKSGLYLLLMCAKNFPKEAEYIPKASRAHRFGGHDFTHSIYLYNKRS